MISLIAPATLLAQSARPPSEKVAPHLKLYSRAQDRERKAVPVATVLATTSAAGFQFIPITPCRVADTRAAYGTFGGPSLAAASTREFDIPQSGCGIPTVAVAYSLNVTVVPAGELDYLTLWPAGQPQPGVSTLNSLDGRIKANAAITPAGLDGGVSVYVSDATNVILDIDGYFVIPGSSGGTSSALQFYSLAPCRIADTRNAAGPLGGPFLAAATSRSFPVQSSACAIPATAQAYSLNVTALPHTTLTYLTTWPTGENQPGVSTLNALTGAITANAAIVPAGNSATNGAVSIYVSDDADVILDVNGYFAPPATGGLSLYTTTPCRALDTRSASGAINGTLAVDVGSGSCAPPATAQAYVLNATVVPPAALTYLTLWPHGETQPTVSTLNALDGAITSNMAIVPTTNGTIDAYSSNTTQLILDLSSYFAPSTTPQAGEGGSNYGWYHLDPPCSREPYGVVYNYDTATATIDAQLQQMYSAGQRRLRVPIYFARGINSGSIMDSTGGNLAPRFQTNLANLLAAIKAAGFVEIEVSFNPQSANDATQWTTFSNDYFQENWSLIQNLRPIIAAAGIPYHIDLTNEGIPPTGDAALLQYDQMLWNDYVAAFGSSDTLGFSIIADDAHLGQVSAVYGPSSFGSHGSPPLFDVHIYDDTGASFAAAYSFLTAQGYQALDWIIGEAFYNDAAEATSLRQQSNSTGQTVLYLTQWPVTSDRTCSPDVNVAPPINFSNYQAQNF